MAKLTEEEIKLFDAIMEVYQEQPALAMSCINEKNEEKFSFYLENFFPKQKLLKLEYKEFAKFIRKNTKVRK